MSIIPNTLVDPDPLMLLLGTAPHSSFCIIQLSDPTKCTGNDHIPAFLWHARVCKLTADPKVPRQLLNALWSFERKEFMQCPETMSVDGQVNTNHLRKIFTNMTGRNGNRENIRAAQCIQQDGKTRTYVKIFAKLLPRVLPLETVL